MSHKVSKLSPHEVAKQFAALRDGRIAEYVGGGWIAYRSRFQTGTLCSIRIRVSDASAAIAKTTRGKS